MEQDYIVIGSGIAAYAFVSELTSLGQKALIICPGDHGLEALKVSGNFSDLDAIVDNEGLGGLSHRWGGNLLIAPPEFDELTSWHSETQKIFRLGESHAKRMFGLVSKGADRPNRVQGTGVFRRRFSATPPRIQSTTDWPKGLEWLFSEVHGFVTDGGRVTKIVLSKGSDTSVITVGENQKVVLAAGGVRNFFLVNKLHESEVSEGILRTHLVSRVARLQLPRELDIVLNQGRVRNPESLAVHLGNRSTDFLLYRANELPRENETCKTLFLLRVLASRFRSPKRLDYVVEAIAQDSPGSSSISVGPDGRTPSVRAEHSQLDREWLRKATAKLVEALRASWNIDAEVFPESEIRIATGGHFMASTEAGLGPICAVKEDLAVRGLANAFTVGSNVFHLPRSNPTFTVVALAAGLANKLSTVAKTKNSK